MNRNPFFDEPRGRLLSEHEIGTSKVNMPQNAYRSVSSQPSHKPRTMCHSQSESDITYSSSSSTPIPSLTHSGSFSGGIYTTKLVQQKDSSSRSPQRRMPPSRTPSPTKRLPELPDLDENVELDLTKSPSKRSKSPTKQMFGEKGWLNQSPGAKSTKDEQNRKTGIKSFSGKIKQRMGELVGLTFNTTPIKALRLTYCPDGCI